MRSMVEGREQSEPGLGKTRRFAPPLHHVPRGPPPPANAGEDYLGGMAPAAGQPVSPTRFRFISKTWRGSPPAAAT